MLQLTCLPEMNQSPAHIITFTTAEVVVATSTTTTTTL